LWRYKYR